VTISLGGSLSLGGALMGSGTGSSSLGMLTIAVIDQVEVQGFVGGTTFTAAFNPTEYSVERETPSKSAARRRYSCSSAFSRRWQGRWQRSPKRGSPSLGLPRIVPAIHGLPSPKRFWRQAWQ